MIRRAEATTLAPVGVFDSGLGGLSVVCRLRELLPNDQILYLADQLHVPFGGRELSEVCGFACAISEALVSAGARALVMACNISSATALPVVRCDYPQLPVLGMIEAGAAAAVATSNSGRIGILATAGTVRSGAYVHALHSIDPTLHVLQVACPEFVPLVEQGDTASEMARRSAEEYLAPLIASGMDTIILGCTHYPFLLPTLRAIAPDVRFVDPAIWVAADLKDQLLQRGAPAARTSSPAHRFYTTGDLAAFRRQVALLPVDIAEGAEILQASWRVSTVCLG